MSRRRSFWGWGYEDAGPHAAELARAEAGLGAFLPGWNGAERKPPALDAIHLPAPRLALPGHLAAILTTDRYERARHTYGRSYRDLVRALAGRFDPAPDAVAFPRDERDLCALFEHAEKTGVALIPYGGGTSVCGGVEPAAGASYNGTISMDLSRLSGVAEIDEVSRCARIGAGTLGPDIEAALRPHGLSLRHYPQSFEFSTLGGWIATRSGGHFATLFTHIDEMVQSLRLVAPRGTIETRRLPASGAGPDPARLFIGSEGILGVITSAWMRLKGRPAFRASASLSFGDFLGGARFIRDLARSGLYPANCRLLDPIEGLLSGAAPAGGLGGAVALLGFESDDHPLGPWLARALLCARDHGGKVLRQAEHGERRTASPDGDDAAERWRALFLRAPYLRDALVLRGVLVETFETAITWERFEAFHERVLERTRQAMIEECGAGLVACRLTHAYPDGAAPYYTVIARSRPGAELAHWDAIKDAATGAILEGGGTTTHHHAVGRDFRRYYERERPDGFALALCAAKRALDPAWILNPGVLLPAPALPTAGVL